MNVTAFLLAALVGALALLPATNTDCPPKEAESNCCHTHAGCSGTKPAEQPSSDGEPQDCQDEPCNPFEACGCGLCAWQFPPLYRLCQAPAVMPAPTHFFYALPHLPAVAIDHWQPPRES